MRLGTLRTLLGFLTLLLGLIQTTPAQNFIVFDAPTGQPRPAPESINAGGESRDPSWA
jgi:hypothetical protein